MTHSLTGAALARTGLGRMTPLATATLVVAANAPDIDALVLVRGSYASLALRRGITHGPLALLLLPLAITLAILAYDRVWRRRRQADVDPARAGPVLLLATIGVVTHPLLDWLNTYGVRLLMPFSERWYYGDSLFIIDPWVWLVLAAPVVAVYSASRRARVLWAVLGIAATALVMMAPQVPLGARVLWVVGLAALLAASAVTVRRGRVPGPGAARAAVALAAVYILLMIGLDRAGRAEAARAAAAAGIPAGPMMVAPVPANPLAGDIVIETADAYYLGRLDWLARPRVSWRPEPIPHGERTALVLATLQLQEVRDFLRWSRFPYVQVSETPDGHRVRFGDARYPDGMRGGLSGVVVDVAGGVPVRRDP